jgi:hypothetical protein
MRCGAVFLLNADGLGCLGVGGVRVNVEAYVPAIAG